MAPFRGSRARHVATLAGLARATVDCMTLYISTESHSSQVRKQGTGRYTRESTYLMENATDDEKLVRSRRSGADEGDGWSS
ncbi:hypothetical protein BDZ90DRAFT_4135 [Jaminaea rosea]|uniref:Uncharacterized protein n=1 Tax=Jaminaea rosea TaxID=1569628 RepID=A0A316UXZ0_9BASI|nr:hypothetical protein BDZ90DRAFT_4135 [Jaminaea rosea]PWN30082.1 hypothetical protein BDZ90DRAFT_4135 [Jaminaea rosea]